MRVDVDDAGGYDEACGVDHTIGDVVIGDVFDCDDLVALDGDIADFQLRSVGVKEFSAVDAEVASDRFGHRLSLKIASVGKSLTASEGYSVRMRRLVGIEVDPFER